MSEKFQDHTAFSLATTTALGRGWNFVTPDDISAAEEVLALLDSAGLLLKGLWRAMGSADAIDTATVALGNFEQRPDPGLFLALIVLCVASAKVIRDHEAE
ncbi:hypothetical protein B4N89_46155 [Embleya scabrispora]|uniref:Uncharacterized protein n=1 Tax=Embleya scabrispora TaxID=159449 RepID=A0A1T3NJG0_9ACTN|nr:hypothetical protein B4N89_46155 [Embleya scabrispora]